jgi:uncharacterized protein (DUF2235 family)
MTKRIVICSDGTWNRPDQRSPTNVAKMALAVAPTAPDGATQIVGYDQGVGTGNLLDRVTGGAFGSGLDQNIADAYRFLMNNYDEGDQIFLFGFSRGAYTVRSTVGLIRKGGLLEKRHSPRFQEAYQLYRRRDVAVDAEEAKRFRAEFSREVEIHFIGVWDTVGGLGIPVRGLRFLTRRRYEFHDVELSRIVMNAYHALAIDERRGPFTPTLWENKQKEGQLIEQAWFAGVHSDVGGGCKEAGLSDVAFAWMKEKAEGCGLAFDQQYINGVVHPDELGVLHNSMTGLYRLTRGTTRPIGQERYANQGVHQAAVNRHNGDANYRPENLVDYLAHPGHRIVV